MQFSCCSISHKNILFVAKAVSYRLMIIYGHFLPGKIKKSFKKMTLSKTEKILINPLSPELNPICYLLALLAHDFLRVSRIRVKSLTLRLLMSHIYIYGAPTLDVSGSHTTTQHSRYDSSGRVISSSRGVLPTVLHRCV
jgi:hypothetical protein